MQLVVTELPESPRDCLFSKRDKKYRIYECTLHSYIPEADYNDDGYKPNCICKNVDKCPHLIKIDDVR